MKKRASLVAQTVKNLPAMWETWVRSLGQEDPPTPGGRHGNLLQDSCLENPMDRGAWWATVHGVAKGQSPWGRKGSDRTEQLMLSRVTNEDTNPQTHKQYGRDLNKHA